MGGMTMLCPRKYFAFCVGLGIFAFGVVGAVAVLLPFLDREKPVNTQRWVSGLACIFLAYMAAMTVYGWVAK